MIKVALTNLAKTLNIDIKTLVWIGSLIGALSGAYLTAQKLLAMPLILDKHVQTTEELKSIVDKQLCIMVADHRKVDWQLCWINPAMVVPKEP